MLGNIVYGNRLPLHSVVNALIIGYRAFIGILIAQPIVRGNLQFLCFFIQETDEARLNAHHLHNIGNDKLQDFIE